MPPLNLSIKLLGRPVKPVSLGISIFMAVLTIFNLADTGVFGASLYGDIIAVISASSFTLLVLAWIINSQLLTEYGLLLASTVFVVRGTFLGLTLSWGRQDVYFSLAMFIISAGSYFLERTDSKVNGGKR
jgi:hypothetical protein